MEAESPLHDPAPSSGGSAVKSAGIKGFKRVSVFDEIPDDDLATDVAADDLSEYDDGDFVPV